MYLPKILIVEDEAPQRRIIRAWLESEGHVCVEAQDGVEGLEQLDEHGDSIKVIVLDILMPRMDGREFLEIIRSRPRSSTPVVVCTGLGTNELGTLDVFTMFHKPIDRKAFLAHIQKAFYFGTRRTSIMGKVTKMKAALCHMQALAM